MARDLEAYLRVLEERGPVPFAWAQPRDCISFANETVKALTGRDVLGDLRWSSFREAKAVIEAVGGLEAELDRRLTRIAPAHARRGDLGGIPDPVFGFRIGSVEGPTIAGPGSRGLKREPRTAMTAAWSVDDG